MRLLSPRSLLFIAGLIAIQGAASPSFAQTPSTTYSLPAVDPGSAGGSHGHGSKLGSSDSVILQVPVATPLPANPGVSSAQAKTKVDSLAASATTSAACYSLQNYSGNSYFVPWNTPYEWSQFLVAAGAANQLTWEQANNKPYTPSLATPLPAGGGWLRVSVNTCCLPQTVGKICDGVNGPVISTAQLGYRYNDSVLGNGVAPQGNANWGANGDVYTAFASDITQNPPINFDTTFQCRNGVWQQTRSEGSCIPLDGSCASNIAALTSLPADTSLLCGTGSIFGGFTNPGGGSVPGPWSWTCLGTPGRQNASCQTGPTDGQCGKQNNIPYAGWGGPNGPYRGWVNATYPSQNLCANGTTSSAVTGPDVNTYANSAVTVIANDFHWSCAGTGGSNVSASCSAADATGICAGVNYVLNGEDGSHGFTAPDPATDFLCLEGTPGPITHGLGKDGIHDAWNWNCIGANSSAGEDSCSFYDDNGPKQGACGSANNQIFTSQNLSNTQLCDINSILTSGPTQIMQGNVLMWTWTCQGLNGGSIQQCRASYDANPGICGSAVGSGFRTTAPPSGSALCQSGTPVPPIPFTDGWTWYWFCQGSGNTFASCTTPVQFDGQCGTDINTTTTTQPSNTCSGNSRLEYWPFINASSQWQWACDGWGGGSNITCTATYPPQQPPPPQLCGLANNSQSASQPTQNLCIAGSTPITINANTDGSGWTWTCQSNSSNTTVSSCNATFATGTGPGVCGFIDGAGVPTTPNINLCQSGLATLVGAVTTPQQGWTWQCMGLGAYVGQDSPLCSADLCNSSGTIGPFAVNNIAVTGTMSGCTVQGRASWNETDAVVQSQTAMTLSWTAPFPFSWTISGSVSPPDPDDPPLFCRPAYQQAQSITNLQITVHKIGACSDPTLNSGPVTITPTGLTLTP